ncbi:LysM peptidoglycan-binding domain-containing protein [Streptosporangium sp. NBC_01639]|uniref:LysM peptidoglycan-binding domain-containing protein n=1 Tax=Streptosporangium sp. NBC_01639 TaxID=2975948 RepID=UPI00387079EC|nr:LysM peptidoglycan-binding domain-containing protein [Streptosporangium sp. NBC_01639]
MKTAVAAGGAGRAGARRPGPVGNIRYAGAPFRLTRRGRGVVLAALALIALGVLWAAARIDAASAVEQKGRAGLPRVVVRGGDTLWEIADAVTKENDLTPTVNRIMDLNDLSGSVIQPGARLYLPGGPSS